MPKKDHLYIVRLPHDSIYDEMLRDQGYLDYIFYLKRHAIGVTLIDLQDPLQRDALEGIPVGARVVIAVMRTSQIRYGLTVARNLKRHRRAVIIFGKLINYGAFSTPYLNCSRDRFIDYVIPAKCGEAAVLGYLQGDPSLLIKNTAGQKTPDRKAVETALSDLRVSTTHHHPRFLTYEISRGCPNCCYYCANSLSGFQHKKVSRVVAEIRKLVRINKISKLVFVGPEINFNRDYLAELMAKLAFLKIRWTAYAVPRGLDRPMLARMKRAGCVLLSLGLESADQGTLDTIGKGTRIKEIARILRNCHALGIGTQVSIIVGFPHETDGDIGKLKQFIRVNRKFITNINISDLVIPKDSRIARDPESRGIVADRSEEGEFFSFYENGRSAREKQVEIAARIDALEAHSKSLGISCFTVSTPFDQSFEQLYLRALDIGPGEHCFGNVKGSRDVRGA